MTPPRLLLLLTLSLGASGRDPPGLPASPEAPPASSWSGPEPRGEPRVGSAGGRAQCPAGPCGKPVQNSPLVLLRAQELSGRGGISLGELLQQQLGHDPHPGTHPEPHPHYHPSPDPAHAPPASTPVTTALPGTGTPGTAPPSKGQLSTAERYALGTVAGVALALCPLLALALLRCPLCHRAQRWLHPLLLGLAAGTLSGDALLHLLPQLLGSHSHGHGHGGRSEAGESWAALGVLGGLYGAFLTEKLLQMLLPSGGEGGPRCQLDVGQQLDAEQRTGSSSGSSAELVKVEEGEPPPLSPEAQSRGLLWTVALGGGAHSLGDGLALGAAFAHSWSSGAGTGLALLCHQLPHAFGTCSALSQSGLRGRWALALAAGWALPVLPGLYVGLALGSEGPARAWLSAATTGLLLHLALARMVPSLVWAQDRRPWVLLGVQSLGLLGGWGLLLGLAVAEDILTH